MKFRFIFGFVFLFSCAHTPSSSPMRALVLMTDFGVKDGAVSAMKGVAFQTAPHIQVSDLTHEIPPYNIWEGSYRLQQTYKYWPEGTVFVVVVDPGVGSERRSVALKTRSGHYFVGPDNGLWTLLEEETGFSEIRVVDESKQRLKGSEESYTFHGRDLYVYVGARLARGQTQLQELGPLSEKALVKIAYQKPVATGKSLKGLIPILDSNYGNVWSNIPKSLVLKEYPKVSTFLVKIFEGSRKVYKARVPLKETFAGVPTGQPLLYYNSLMNLSLALNMASFAEKYKVQSGPNWTVEISP